MVCTRLSKICLKMPSHVDFLIVLSFIEIKQSNFADLCRLTTCIKSVNFVRIVKGTRPALGGNNIGKFRNFHSFGDVEPHP